MEFDKDPIDTIARAKTYFQAMGCSTFHMSRDYPQRYDEYRILDIPKDMEQEWTYEALNELASELRNTSTMPGLLWKMHSRMDDLLQGLGTEDALLQVYDATESICERVPPHTKVYMAETIIGRGPIKCRTGLIFRAYDLDRIDLARRFAEISLSLSTSAKEAKIEVERCDEAISDCNEIRKSLGL